MEAFSKTLASFSCDLAKELVKDEQKNIAFSPFPCFKLLKMVMHGAGGNTKSEMEKVLHASQECLPKDCEELQSKLKELMSHSKSGADYELDFVNALFAEKTIKFQDQYLQQMKKDFNVELNPADFKHNADIERQKINEWVKCNTKGNITEVYGKGSLDESTSVALVNAIYYRGPRAIKFKPENTKEGTFNVNKNEKKSVQMMCYTGKFKCIDVPEINSKGLLYPHEEETVVILLPKEIEGINELLSKLTPELMISVVQSNDAKEAEVEVKMPKVSLDGHYELKPKLVEMGMKDVFQPSADLSGMSTDKGVVLSSVAHKCCIDLHDTTETAAATGAETAAATGAETAAATGAEASATSAPAPESFTVDRPFMLYSVKNKDCLMVFEAVIFSP